MKSTASSVTTWRWPLKAPQKMTRERKPNKFTPAQHKRLFVSLGSAVEHIRLSLLFIVGIWQGAFAQKYEISPYAGGFWPMKVDDFQLRDQGIWGVRGGYFFSDRVQLEGNFGYLNLSRRRPVLLSPGVSDKLNLQRPPHLQSAPAAFGGSLGG
jgi:hypothetical protein